MDFGKLAKVIGYGLFKESGIPVTPEQFGLKPPTSGTGQGFSQLIADRLANTNGVAGVTVPTMPTPPVLSPEMTPAEMVAAQTKYNQELAAYHQKVQMYQMQMMQIMMNRISMNNNTGSSLASSSLTSLPTTNSGFSLPTLNL